MRKEIKIKYIFTDSNCPKCVTLKARYKSQNIPFEERQASRLKNPEDKIDQEGLIQAALQNEELPVEVEV